MAAESRQAGWPGRVAVGVVRSDPPQVFLADSDAVLGRLLAIKLVAQQDPRTLHKLGALDTIRTALTEERWADALVAWMQATGEVVDAYPDDEVWTGARLDAELAALEIKFAPVFQVIDDEGNDA